MKMRLSYKDLILLVGILVAVAIALSTWMYSSTADTSGSMAKPEAGRPKTSLLPEVFIKKVHISYFKASAANRATCTRSN